MGNKKQLHLKAAVEADKEQANLREAYGIKSPNVVVVERKSRIVLTFRILLSYFFLLLRVAAVITLSVLAIIGLFTLVHPDIRIEFMDALTQTLSEFKNMVGI